MGTVITGFSMSLDGFVAGPNEAVSQIFSWIGKDVGVTHLRFRVVK